MTSTFALLMAALGGCHLKEVPRLQKLGVCGTNACSFKLAIPAGNHFELVLGLPHSGTNTLNFQGELVFREASKVVAQLPIGSDNVTECNWLDQPTHTERLAGYILTWNRPSSEKLDHFCHAGQSYDVEIRFTKPPPPSSSLWLHWLGR